MQDKKDTSLIAGVFWCYSPDNTIKIKIITFITIIIYQNISIQLIIFNIYYIIKV